MCIFRRLFYNSCSHHLYLGPDPVRKCHLQLAYECGETEVPCGKMLPHSYMSLKINEPCKACAFKTEKAGNTLSRIKEQLAMAKLKLKIPAEVRMVGTGQGGKKGKGEDKKDEEEEEEEEALSPVELMFSGIGIGRGVRKSLAVTARE